jgi:hypothetical protein
MASTDKETGEAVARMLKGESTEPTTDDTDLEARVTRLEQAAQPEPTGPTDAEFLTELFNDRKQRAGLEALGLVESEPEEAGKSDDDRKVDFDGGARQPAPSPSDPERDHAELVTELAAAKEVERGAGGWRLRG